MQNQARCCQDIKLNAGKKITKVAKAVKAGCKALGKGITTALKAQNLINQAQMVQILVEKMINGEFTWRDMATVGMMVGGRYLRSNKTPPWMSAANKKRSSKAKTGPYSHLEDPPDVGPGKDFTAAQKKKIIEENKKRNNGVVKSDDPNDVAGSELVKPGKSQKGVTPPENEWQIDHIESKDSGGCNSYSNAQVLSRKQNRIKSNK